MPAHSQFQIKVAIKTGAATVLICSGVIFFAARLFFDVYEMVEGRPLEKPGSFAVGMMFVGLVMPFLALGAAVFTFLISVSRCHTKAVGVITAASALALMTGLVVLPFVFRDLNFLMLLFPAVWLVKSMGPSVGWYLGSCMQFALGAWLLGWLDRFTPGRATGAEPSAPSNGGPAASVDNPNAPGGPPSVS
jgi:hypothetical protein